MSVTDSRDVAGAHSWMLRGVVALAAVLMVFYTSQHIGHGAAALSIALLVTASVFDAISGTIPLLLLLASAAAAGFGAVLDHRIPWLALSAAPFGYVAATSREDAIGWGDVLSIGILALALPFWAAIIAIVAGSALSLAATLFTRSRSGRMTPYLALAGVAALWISAH